MTRLGAAAGAAALAATLGLTGTLALTERARADVLTARLQDGTEIARLEMPEGSGWCVVWRHSVDGFEVQDCYENRGGAMVLVKSLQPDFAAGLGHIPGRGVQRSDGQGGYLIEELDEPVPGNAYILRPGGPAVDHRLRTARAEVSLSRAAPRARVTLALTSE
ncbi:DUF1850 domain-containing protein [Algihabitans albus]|uniref:DUF1850 domain-containing protein n=1 Tax=Algihabitans albus TaxID=2164067 RepID=UPI001ABCFF01|nr:DUF1850 domain-containing protein [Algihabitans albus]